MSKIYSNGIFLFLISIICCSCGGSLPKDFTITSDSLVIYPDYQNVEMPYNIAPLNFRIMNSCVKGVVSIKSENGNEIIVEINSKKDVAIPKKQWHNLLNSNKGKSVFFNVYLQEENGKWIKYNQFVNKISDEAIDRYVTYRLIEPSYMSTGCIGLYQYDLEQAEQTTIITNHRIKKISENIEQSCVNCHSAQRNKPENTLFYYRGKGGGLVLTYNGKVKKINTQTGDMFAGTVYTAWHPTLPFIAFSSNVIRQSFPNKGKEKVYVYDFISDLVLYDIEKNEITSIFKTKDKQETFPYWNGEGTELYFCSTDSFMHNPSEVKKMKYDLKKVKFNKDDKTWGEPELVYCASKDNKSSFHPRPSYDDKYLMFAIAEFGPTGYTQRCSDLYLMNLESKEVRAINETNTQESECYHAWCSKNNWFLYVGRVEDGNYGRVYFAHVDSFGRVSKPFPMPHENPLYDFELLKSYNAPEFSSAPVSISEKEYEDEIYGGEAIKANYGSPITDTIDVYSGASKVKK